MLLQRTIGPTIRRIRATKGFQVQEVAARVPMSRSYLSEIEHGHKFPSIELLGDIAAGLDVEVTELWYQIYENMEKQQ